jgi:hypothetical protein
MENASPLFNDDTRTHLLARSDDALFALMRDADADAFNSLCEEALRRGLVRG